MAGVFQQQLKSSSPNTLHDYKHASLIFRSRAYANTPKFKWLFHVYFDINRTLISDRSDILPAEEIPGLLVKNINLPKFSVTLAEMNQYNRKRYVQTKVSYDPCQITFHDDNNGQIRQMWNAYFSYYFYDINQPGQPSASSNANVSTNGSKLENDAAILNRRTTYDPDISNNINWGLLTDNIMSTAGKQAKPAIAKAPFFKSIKVFGFNQHNFSMYQFINPIIERFEHDSYDYYATTTMENRMTIRYETVKYGQGALNGKDPSEIVTGFGLDGEYDKNLSPIAIPGTNGLILGKNGMKDPGAGVLNALPSPTVYGPVQRAQDAGAPSNVFYNPPGILTTRSSVLLAGSVNVGLNLGRGRSGFNFPSISASVGVSAQLASSSNFRNPNPAIVPTIQNNPIATADPLGDLIGTLRPPLQNSPSVVATPTNLSN
jgi:hypothetical protein